jgi:hypothetical protein
MLVLDLIQLLGWQQTLVIATTNLLILTTFRKNSGFFLPFEVIYYQSGWFFQISESKVLNGAQIILFSNFNS